MKRMYVGGSWVEAGGGGVVEVYDPATEEVLDAVPSGTAADAARAAEAADRAFPAWRRVGALDRCEMLHEAARKLRTGAGEVVRLLTLEEGKPIPEHEEEVEWTIGTLDYYAEMSRSRRGRVVPSAEPEQLNMVVKEPYGAVACLVPFNYPLLLMIWKVAPALAAGNTVIIKPSSHTPLATLLLAEKVFDHFPPGVVNVLTGPGGEVGDALVQHPDVPLIAFTGSTRIGKRITRLGAERVKRLHLELGGKDPFVVAPDADVAASADALVYAALINAGQVCTSTERVYVPESMAGEFVDAVVDRVQALRLGPGIEPTTDIGPLAAPGYRDKVAAHVADAVDRGARVLAGGRVPPGMDRGWYYEPTVLVDVDHSMLCMREETFGPTIPIMAYRDFDEAIALANDTEYGLGAVVRTNDARTAKRFMEEVRAGTIWVNDPLTDNYAGPFGGMKASGTARELGEEGLDAFLDTKHIHWDFDDAPKDWWFPY